jgi:hypothetical protein
MPSPALIVARIPAKKILTFFLEGLMHCDWFLEEPNLKLPEARPFLFRNLKP